ncbi:PEP-CTERM sorting domain-containing protein [Microcystis flos-aquae]|uniref:PEP-CTERM sorting domain-containing protein n=1 Tax=Microcystis flos-aquae TaxID=109615 RepID=UPI0030FF2237
MSNGDPAQGVSFPLTVTGQKVPEPSTVLGLGLLGLGALVKRQLKPKPDSDKA